jgi:hypothetical protein
VIAQSGTDIAAALRTLEQHAMTPRAHAAIKTLRNELDVGNGKPTAKNDAPTPGRRSAGTGRDAFAAAASQAASRFGRKK